MASNVLDSMTSKFPADQSFQQLSPTYSQVRTLTYDPRSTVPLPPPSPSIPCHPISNTNINPQQISPLYLIPPELRDAIFTYVFLGTPDVSQPYSHTARSIIPPPKHQPRRSYPHRVILHTTLLQTCKLVYFEARHLPLSINQHVFWPRDFREPIEPSHATYPIHTAPYFKKLLPWQQRSVLTVRFNVPEPGLWKPNLIHQRIAWALFKKKTTGLMDPDLDLRNLRTLVWDCHNPIFYMDQKYEEHREENMRANYSDGFDLIRRIEGLREVVLVIDWRHGSKIWDFVRGLDLGRLKLVDDGRRDVNRQEEEAGPLAYVLRTLRWVLADGATAL